MGPLGGQRDHPTREDGAEKVNLEKISRDNCVVGERALAVGMRGLASYVRGRVLKVQQFNTVELKVQQFNTVELS